MRCPRCGAVLRDDAEQCGFCGEKIVPVVSFEKPIIENRPRDEAFDVENTVKKPAQPEIQENHGQNPVVIAIILLSGVLCAAIAVLLFYSLKSSQRAVVNVNTSAPSESLTETEAPATTPYAGTVSPEESADEAAEVPGETGEASGESEEAASGESQALYDDREFEGLVYRFSGNQAVIVGCKTDESWIEVPDTVDGVPVVGISEGAFTDCTSLEYIDLPEGVAWIGAYAFLRCSHFKEIVMPDSLVTIGDGSFNNCPSFTIVSHEGSSGHAFAEYHNLNWIEGDFLVPVE